MYISDVHDYSEQKTDVVKQFLSKERRKAITYEVEEIVNDEFERLGEYANDYISQTAADRAELFLEKVLAGDDDAAHALFCTRGDRYKTTGHDKEQPWSELIHGHLFETGGIELRRKLVEAHADLIRNERIADLESIVDGLTIQIKKMGRQIDDMSQRL